MNDTIELKPCPFCGSKNLEVHGKPGILNAHDDVGCNDCNAFSPLPTWNRRAQSDSVPDEAESIDDRIRILSRKLGLARNHNPSPAQLRAAGIELVRPEPPKSPPAKHS